MDPSDPVLIHVQGISRSRREDDHASHTLSSYSFSPRLSNAKTACSPLHSTVDAVEDTFDDTEFATTSFRTRFSDTHLLPPTAERQQQNFSWVAHHSWNLGLLGGEYPASSTRDPSQWPRQEYLSPGTANQSRNSKPEDELNQFIQKHSVESVYAACSLADTRHYISSRRKIA